MIVGTEATAKGPRVTSLRAVRKKCLSCCLGSPREVRRCSITDCPLRPYRFGKRSKDVDSGDRLTPVKAIRRKCLDCSAYSPAEVRGCQIRDCVLHRSGVTKSAGEPVKRASSGQVKSGHSEEMWVHHEASSPKGASRGESTQDGRSTSDSDVTRSWLVVPTNRAGARRSPGYSRSVCPTGGGISGGWLGYSRFGSDDSMLCDIRPVNGPAFLKPCLRKM